MRVCATETTFVPQEDISLSPPEIPDNIPNVTGKQKINYPEQTVQNDTTNLNYFGKYASVNRLLDLDEHKQNSII